MWKSNASSSKVSHAEVNNYIHVWQWIVEKAFENFEIIKEILENLNKKKSLEISQNKLIGKTCF